MANLNVNSTMDRLGDVVTIRHEGTEPVAFHARTLDVAAIDMSVIESLQALKGGSTPATDAQSELLDWIETDRSAVTSTFKPGVKSLTLNVTQICNLHCTYCAAGGDGTYGKPMRQIEVEKTRQQLTTWLNQLSNGETFHVNFFGGEPMLVPEVIESLVEHAQMMTAGRDIKLDFSITTNGTLFNDKVVSLIKKANPRLQISLDGPAEYNDQQRKTKNGTGSTQIVLDNIPKFKSLRGDLRSLEINAVFDANYHDVEKTWEFFQALPVDLFDFEFSVTETDDAASEAFARGMWNVAQAAFAKGGEKELIRIKTFRRYFKQFDSQVKNVNFCGAGKTSFVVDAENKVYTCPWEAGQEDKVVGIGDAISQDAVKSLQDPLIELNDCGSCWARYVCGGGCMFAHRAATGDKHRTAPIFCQRTRSVIAAAVVYYSMCRG